MKFEKKIENLSTEKLSHDELKSLFYEISQKHELIKKFSYELQVGYNKEKDLSG